MNKTPKILERGEGKQGVMKILGFEIEKDNWIAWFGEENLFPFIFLPHHFVGLACLKGHGEFCPLTYNSSIKQWEKWASTILIKVNLNLGAFFKTDQHYLGLLVNEHKERYYV